MLNYDVIPGVMNILQPHTLSPPLEMSLHHRVMRLLKTVHYSTNIPEFFDVSGSSRQSQMNDAIFEQVLIPSEAYLRSLCSNRYFVLESESADMLLEFFLSLIDMSTFHSPASDFIVSLPIALSITSLLSVISSNSVRNFIDTYLTILRDWRELDPYIFKQDNTIVRSLNSEGFDDVLDQSLFTLRQEFLPNTQHGFDPYASFFGANNVEPIPWY
ncbi:hypothetical protein BLNAU_9500 [Blattamonas nauphoetae]|uniref:Uncharacterized protein n=1 Tax=Blattamonas nauphoetae TaxID=2049346 RepID=A0ABQ9XVE1_9EUKA|nr:hypothetical protein BLNAU_9500 [Blattamonas nauphoetae]